MFPFVVLKQVWLFPVSLATRLIPPTPMVEVIYPSLCLSASSMKAVSLLILCIMIYDPCLEQFLDVVGTQQLCIFKEHPYKERISSP